MFDILSFFIEDTTSYAAKSIVMYVFDETRTDEFIKGSLDSYRRAYISDEDMYYLGVSYIYYGDFSAEATAEMKKSKRFFLQNLSSSLESLPRY